MRRIGSHLIKAFAVLPLHVRSCPNTVEGVVLPRLNHIFVHILQTIYHNCDEEIQHQDDHNHLVDSPERHQSQMRELQRKVFFRIFVLVSHVPGVVFGNEHLIRAVSINVSPKEDVEE